MFCPKCGGSLIDDTRLRCPKCKNFLGNEFMFCPYCGWELNKNYKNEQSPSVIKMEEPQEADAHLFDEEDDSSNLSFSPRVDYGHGSKRISWARRSATEREMMAFSKICDVAKHGVQYEENWKALGYSYPKKGLLSFFTKPEDTPAIKKSKLLKEFLLDTIVSAGLDVIDLSPGNVYEYLLNNNKQLSDKDLHEGLRYRSFHYGEKEIDRSEFSLENRLKEEGLPAYDAKKLQSVLAMIRASYTDIFMHIFKDY